MMAKIFVMSEAFRVPICEEHLKTLVLSEIGCKQLITSLTFFIRTYLTLFI